MTVSAPLWLTAPALVVDRLPVTLVAPKAVVPLAVVVVVRPAAEPETPRLPPAISVAAPEAVMAAFRALVSVIWMVEPVAVTSPVKLLLALVSVMVWPLADTLLVPVTVSAPLWLTAPALVVDRLPVTLVAPKAVVPPAVVVVVRPTAEPETPRLPPAISVAAPEAVMAAFRALVSVIWTAAPVAETLPVKSLPVLVRVMA